MSKSKYWSMKDSEIKQIIEDRKLIYDMDKFSRKTAIELITVNDVQAGKGTTALEDDGESIIELKKSEGFVKVRFHNVSDSDVPYIFLGHNGKGYYIPKEEDIWVPRFLLDSVVKDAVEIRMESKKRPDGKIQQVQRKFQRFPYTMIEF